MVPTSTNEVGSFTAVRAKRSGEEEKKRVRKGVQPEKARKRKTSGATASDDEMPPLIGSTWRQEAAPPQSLELEMEDDCLAELDSAAEAEAEATLAQLKKEAARSQALHQVRAQKELQNRATALDRCRAARVEASEEELDWLQQGELAEASRESAQYGPEENPARLVGLVCPTFNTTASDYDCSDAAARSMEVFGVSGWGAANGEGGLAQAGAKTTAGRFSTWAKKQPASSKSTLRFDSHKKEENVQVLTIRSREPRRAGKSKKSCGYSATSLEGRIGSGSESEDLPPLEPPEGEERSPMEPQEEAMPPSEPQDGVADERQLVEDSGGSPPMADGHGCGVERGGKWFQSGDEEAAMNERHDGTDDSLPHSVNPALDNLPLVKLHGLVRWPSLNGFLARLSGYDANTKRWHVVLHNGQSLRLRDSNVRKLSLEEDAKQGAVFVFGGFNGSTFIRSCVCWASSWPMWNSLPNMTESRCNATVAVIGPHIFIMGGMAGRQLHQATAGREALDTMECLDTQSMEWVPVPKMPQARRCAAVAVVGEDIYLCGGFSEINRCLTSMDCYRTVTQSWRSLPNMLHGRSWPTLARLGRSLYAVGGCHSTSSGVTMPMNTVERFSLDANVWDRVFVRKGLSHSFGVVVVDEDLYLCGGEDAAGKSVSSAMHFSHQTGQWDTLPDMLQSRCAPSVAATPSGDICVVGGCHKPIANRNGVPIASCEIFRTDPGARHWTALQSMSTPRSFASSATVGGYLYVLGGFGVASRPTSSAERFDLANESWAELPRLPVPVLMSSAASVEVPSRSSAMSDAVRDSR